MKVAICSQHVDSSFYLWLDVFSVDLQAEKRVWPHMTANVLTRTSVTNSRNTPSRNADLLCKVLCSVFLCVSKCMFGMIDASQGTAMAKEDKHETQCKKPLSTSSPPLWLSGDNKFVWSSAPVVSRWLLLANRTFLEVDSMVASWWIVAFLPSETFKMPLFNIWCGIYPS